MVSPEYRYWFKRPLYSHYIGAHITTAMYDIALNTKQSEGAFVAVGIGYGYSVLLGKRWSLMPYVGFGVAYKEIVDRQQRAISNYEFKPMITRLGVSLTYIIN